MKRSIIFILTVVISFIYISCEKNEYKSLSGDIILTGYAYLIDSFKNALPLPLNNQKIFLNQNNDTSSYIYQVNTDSVGFFSIPALKKNSTYTLFTRFIKNSVEYFGAETLEVGESDNVFKTKLNVYPKNLNGMYILFFDSLGGALTHFPFRIYNSKIFASVDSTKYAFADTVSDINGHYIRFNISPITYYITATTSVGLQRLKISDSVTVPTNGVVQRSVVLSNVMSNVQNGFTVVVTDSLGGTIPNASIYLYTSQVLANSNDSTAAADVSSTDSNGKYSKNNLPSGTYYLNSTKRADTITYQRLAKPINVPLTGIVSDTIVLRKR